jgi:hypothetical protein
VVPAPLREQQITCIVPWSGIRRAGSAFSPGHCNRAQRATVRHIIIICSLTRKLSARKFVLAPAESSPALATW